MTHDEMIAVIQAHKEGKTIQYRILDCDESEWIDGATIAFNFPEVEYRIKPEPPKEENTLIQNLLDYFKRTTKEQRQKDWDEIKNLYPYENEDWSEVFREPIPLVEDKPELHYRPFKNAEEVMEAIKERGYYVKWKEDGKNYVIGAVCDEHIQPYLDDSYTFAEAFDNFTWPDGTPFGKLEE